MITTITPHEALVVVGHTLAVYIALVVGLRLAGRRQLGQLTVIDLVIIIVMGSAVETSMVAGNTTLYAGLVCAATLFIFNRTLTFLMLRSRRLEHLVAGGPSLLVHNGHFVEEHLRREGLTKQDVMEAIRERGEDDLANVRFAVMEADGTINVVPMDAHAPRGDTPSPAPRAPENPPDGNPASGDPASGDPASGDPASGDPASGDPASGDPASGDPAGRACEHEKTPELP